MAETNMAKANDEVGKAQDFLTSVLDLMKIPSQVKAAEQDERLVLEIECDSTDDTQRIIGRRGQVVDALQHLVGKVLVKVRGDKGRIVVVDAGGYRQKHIERLEELARQTAEKCKASGKSVDLSPMPAHDRRIVHMALAAIGGVTTQSEGEGDFRHIVVSPA
jgi:spoIIIJ-associated protein